MWSAGSVDAPKISQEHNPIAFCSPWNNYLDISSQSIRQTPMAQLVVSPCGTIEVRIQPAIERVEWIMMMDLHGKNRVVGYQKLPRLYQPKPSLYPKQLKGKVGL